MRHVANMHELPELKGYKRVIAVIGKNPSEYSKSPNGWNHLMHELDIKGIYVPLDVNKDGKTLDKDPQAFAQFFEDFSKFENLVGFNVTVPYKKTVMPFLRRIDAYAQRVEAVNTVADFVGYNTDGRGNLLSLKDHMSLEGKKVLGIGAGGAANAVYDSLMEEINYLFIANRTVEKAKSLAEMLKRYHLHKTIEFSGLEKINEVAAGVDLILNTTSIGNVDERNPDNVKYSCLAPTDISIDENNSISLKIAENVPTHIVFADVVFNPPESVFLWHGRETGHKTINGLGMLVYQAAIGAKEYILRDELRDIPFEEVSRLIREGMSLPT